MEICLEEGQSSLRTVVPLGKGTGMFTTVS
jgi:hypothetical protein